MCVCVYKKEGEEFDINEFDAMWNRNGDGMGYLVKKPDKPWELQKGIMDRAQAKNLIAEFSKKENILIFHLRLQSRGKVCAENTHPFDWSNKKEKRFLFHNGTARTLGLPGLSDSETIAKIIKLQPTPDALQTLENFKDAKLGKFLVFVDKEGETSIQVFENEECVWRNGIWYSNLIHEETKKAPNYISVLNKTAENREAMDKIVAFYLLKNKLKDTTENRDYLRDLYSLDIMRTCFLEQIAEDINSGKQDPINFFFSQIV